MYDAYPIHRLARWTLASFVLTFLISRVLVLLIMTHRVGDMFLWVGGTHIHHLNYGIFLLAIVGGWALFMRPTGAGQRRMAIVYGIGLGLTFDEFGMWLHLGGGYWQRASYDAVVIIASLLGLLAVVPALGKWRMAHWMVAGVVVLLLVAGLKLAAEELGRLTPALEQLEERGPR